MSADPNRPPAVWLAVVRRLVPAALREDIEGDLIEHWREGIRQSRWRRAWAFWRDAVSVGVRRWHGVVPARTSHVGPVVATLHDIRAAAHLLVRRSGFSVLAIVTLAVGTAASTAVFTIADRVLLRPLPFPEPSRLVAIQGAPALPIQRGRAPEFDRLPQLAGMGTYHAGGLNLGEPDRATRIATASVGARFFEVLGVHPIAGRVITVEDDPGSLLAVVAFDAWQRLFGGDPSLVGRTVRLNSRSYTVIGVMPRDFRFPDNTEIWIPAQADMQATGSGVLGTTPSVVGRLARDVTPTQATDAITSVDDLRRAAGPASGRVRRRPITVVPLQAHLTSDRRPTLLFLVAIVTLLLTATCANAAGLFLSHLRSRDRELLVRSALGAGRWRIMRQLGAEGLVLVAVGSALGLALAIGALHVVTTGIAPVDPGTSVVDIRFLLVARSSARLPVCCSRPPRRSPPAVRTRQPRCGSDRADRAGAGASAAAWWSVRSRSPFCS